MELVDRQKQNEPVLSNQTASIGENCQRALELAENQNKETNITQDATKETSICNGRMAIPHFLIWAGCIWVFAYFALNCFLEYVVDNSVVVTRYRQLSHDEAWVSVRICNIIELDKEKLETHGNESWAELFSFERYQHPLKSGFISLQSGRIQEFKLGLDQFLVGCGIIQSSNESCYDSFKWDIDRVGSCYVAQLNIFRSRQMIPLVMDFYFDKEFRTDEIGPVDKGVFITLYHIEDYASPFDGIFLGPRQQIAASVKIHQRTQTRSYRDAKCVHRYGLQRYTFAETPFEAEYSVASCQDLCVAEWEFRHCNCSSDTSWNMSIVCMSSPEPFNCLYKLNQNYAEFQSTLDHCASICLDKCNKRFLESKVLYMNTGPYPIQYSLNRWRKSSASVKTLAERLHSKIVENDDNPGIINDIAANYSRFVLYLDNAKMRTSDVVPLVTTASFVGNFGGIFGMWLGFSCVSLLQSLHSFLNVMFVKLKNKIQPKTQGICCSLDTQNNL